MRLQTLVGGNNRLSPWPSCRVHSQRWIGVSAVRGRKPKTETVNDASISVAEAESVVDQNETLIEALPKKRGRKPKVIEADHDIKGDLEEAKEPAAVVPEKKTTRRTKVTKAVAEKTQDDVKDPTSIGIATPWSSSVTDVEQQQADLQAYVESRGPDTAERRRRKKKAASPVITVNQVTSELEAKVVRFDANGRPSVDVTALGDGKRQTYALSIYEGKEKKFMEYIEPKLLDMGPVFDQESGAMVNRDVEFILPTKTIKAFSESSLKWSNKVIKYKGGGWLYMRAVLDKELHEMLSGMLYFQGWRNVISYKFPFMEEDVTLPMPCTEDELEEIEAWKNHVDEEAEEVAKCEEYGGKVDLEIAAKVIRRDEMEEDLDVDEFGNKIYRKDYTGTYNNPNNFFEGPEEDYDTEKGYNTGAKKAAERGAVVKKESTRGKKAASEGSSIGRGKKNVESDSSPPLAAAAATPPALETRGGKEDKSSQRQQQASDLHTETSVPLVAQSNAQKDKAAPDAPSKPSSSAWYEPPAPAAKIIEEPLGLEDDDLFDEFEFSNDLFDDELLPPLGPAKSKSARAGAKEDLPDMGGTFLKDDFKDPFGLDDLGFDDDDLFGGELGAAAWGDDDDMLMLDDLDAAAGSKAGGRMDSGGGGYGAKGGGAGGGYNADDSGVGSYQRRGQQSGGWSSTGGYKQQQGGFRDRAPQQQYGSGQGGRGGYDEYNRDRRGTSPPPFKERAGRDFEQQSAGSEATAGSYASARPDGRQQVPVRNSKDAGYKSSGDDMDELGSGAFMEDDLDMGGYMQPKRGGRGSDLDMLDDWEDDWGPDGEDIMGAMGGPGRGQSGGRGNQQRFYSQPGRGQNSYDNGRGGGSSSYQQQGGRGRTYGEGGRGGGYGGNQGGYNGGRGGYNRGGSYQGSGRGSGRGNYQQRSFESGRGKTGYQGRVQEQGYME
ncbi:hypothetical protein CEUSTIGMA_g2557.t1 [Chlamydomonas eustigma]|uniref:Uncharacterized protein n=1 Tax=Chlamydomonas eustigma TaxID=1157962 RepID=A0A250WW87_9CHLO|nr:hypothetical protein CEUSTIGMA_g2557.t1 [Chlamydomonas eustigma]|eukprot:GAX75113.1 hypothetical protein CEUSTIGMA_g2557.t1 [Chlamydomonas eustigma]